MSSYAGVTFSELDPQGFFPEWQQEPNVVVRHPISGNQDIVQGMGRGNFRVTVHAGLSADADLATLRAAVGVTLRTLVLGSTSHANTMLIGVRNPRRLGWAEVIGVDLEFIRAGS